MSPWKRQTEKFMRWYESQLRKHFPDDPYGLCDEDGDELYLRQEKQVFPADPLLERYVETDRP